MTEDWAAVAQAINERMSEIGLTQLELVKRSHVSKTMVHELRRNSPERRRSTRTMESLSLALDWHPQHLIAVLHGRPIPAVGEPIVRSDDDVNARLLAIEFRLEQILSRLDDMKELERHVSNISDKFETLTDPTGPTAEKPRIKGRD